jgi:hypothetical protein
MAAIQPFSKELSGNFCAENSIWRSDVNLQQGNFTKKKRTQGHKLNIPLRVSNRSFGKRMAAIQPFSKELSGNFRALNSIWRSDVNPQQGILRKKISLGHKHPAPR